MASSKPTLTVTLSRDAEDDLIGIWADNVERYKNVDHADGYLEFLRSGINRLATDHGEGKALDGFPEFLYVILRKSKKGHGHYVIYDVDQAEQLVTVLRVYHTRMDIQGRLKAQFG